MTSSPPPLSFLSGQLPHVRHKKNDGTLYLMGERLGWMVRSKDSFSIVHK